MLKDSGSNESFFELIDIEGKDDVLGEMEQQIAGLVNSAIGFVLNLPNYNLRRDLIDNNPNIK